MSSRLPGPGGTVSAVRQWLTVLVIVINLGYLRESLACDEASQSVTLGLTLLLGLAQLSWYRYRIQLSNALLAPVVLVVVLSLISYLLPHHWVVTEWLLELARYLSPAPEIVNWRPTLPDTMIVTFLVMGLLLRTRSSFGVPIYHAIAALLLITEPLMTAYGKPPRLVETGSHAGVFVVLGLLLAIQFFGVVRHWKHNSGSIHRSIWPALVFSVLVVWLWHSSEINANRQMVTRGEQLLKAMSHHLTEEVMGNRNAIHRLARFWHVMGHPPSQRQWQDIAGMYHDDFRYLVNIEFLTPDGRVSQVFPETPQHSIWIGQGLDRQIAAEYIQAQVQQALLNGKEWHSGLLPLTQGVPGFLHYIPVRDSNGVSIGVLCMVMALPELLDTLHEIPEAHSRDFFVMAYLNHQLVREWPAEGTVTPWSFTVSLELLGQPLQLVMQPSSRMLRETSRQPAVTLVLGLVLSCLLYLLLFSHHRMIRQHHSVRLANVELRREVRRRTRLQQRLEWLAHHDELTGLPNRRDVVRQMDALKHAFPVSIIIADIDHFKRVNDCLGHREGDRVLGLVARAGAMAVGQAGTFARYGGEEFIAMLPTSDLDTASRIAEDIRHEVRKLMLRHADGSLLTISLGVATQEQAPLNIDRLAQLADRALYAAKNNGRDQVNIADVDGSDKAERPDRRGRMNNNHWPEPQTAHASA